MMKKINLSKIIFGSLFGILILLLTASAVFAEIENPDLTGATAFVNQIADAKNGDTILLESDVALSAGVLEIKKNLTIDLNGHTIRAVDQTGDLSYLITHTKGTLTICNGRILSEISGGITASKGTLNLNNVEITTLRRALNLSGRAHCNVDADCVLTTTGSEKSADTCVKLIAKYNGLDWGERVWFDCAGVVQNSNPANKQPAIGGNTADVGIVHVTLEDGAKVISNGTAVFLPQRCTLDVYGAEINGQSGIECREGSVTIYEGAVIAADATCTIVDDEDDEDGVTIKSLYDLTALNAPACKSCALVMAQQIGGEPLNVTINGGSFSGTLALCSINLEARADTGVNQPETTVRITAGYFVGGICNKGKALKRSVTGGCFKKKPSSYFDGWQVMIQDNDTGLYYVADTAKAFLKTDTAVGHRIELLQTSDFNDVVPGVTLINRNDWDVKINQTQTISNGREITVE